MGKISKLVVTLVVVLAIAMIVTGIVGATLTFPKFSDRQPTYSFEQLETVANDSFESVKIDGRTIDVKVSTADVNEAQILLTGKLYRPADSSDDFIKTNVRNRELRISFAKEMLIAELQVLGIEVANDATNALQAELILPQKVYRSIKIKTHTGDIVVQGIESRLLDVESEWGDIRYDTAQDRQQLSVKAESDYGTVTIFGERMKNTHGFDREDYDEHDEYPNYVGGGSNWVELESEHGSIDVQEMN
jgi:hypothetical protein